MINRRGLITGLIAFAAAPAIVRVESLMPVKVIKPYVDIKYDLERFMKKLALNSQYGKFSYMYMEGGEVKQRFIDDYEFYKGVQWGSLPDQLASNTERSQQVALMCQAALHIKQYPCLKWLHAIPNANSHKQVSEGVRAGVADVFLPCPMQYGWGEIAAGLYIELKTEKRRKEKNGGLSKEQEEFGKYAIDMGYRWYVCYGWQEAWKQIEEYLKNE